MAEPTKTSWNYVWVKDKAGNEFACPVNVLKKPEEMTNEEKESCLEDASRALPIGD
jgi:hypothetical protein